MSNLSGMTGFARERGAYNGIEWTWEARSVNGKTLDIRMRVPPEFSALDMPVRKIFSDVLHRGNVQLLLTLQSSETGTSYTVNEALLDKLQNVINQKGRKARLDRLMQVPGVVEARTSTRSEDEQKALEAALLLSVKTLAAQLKSARDQEGRALAPILTCAVEKMSELISEAEKLAATQPENLRASLKERLNELLSSDVSEERLTQEAALLALKADVREELDRLKSHCEQAFSHLATGSPIGRKLDFLCQEFNRETNTLCSKSADIDLTRIGLELKSVIEQFREQAANVE